MSGEDFISDYSESISVYVQGIASQSSFVSLVVLKLLINNYTHMYS